MCFILAACVTIPEPPEIDLDSFGWRIRVGQALWTPAEGGIKPIAGDIILARHNTGDAWIDFSKSSLPVFIAQTADGYWWIELVSKAKRWSGHGKPPAKFIWFTVVDAVFQGQDSEHWETERRGALEWIITHRNTNESIKLILDP